MIVIVIYIHFIFIHIHKKIKKSNRKYNCTWNKMGESKKIKIKGVYTVLLWSVLLWNSVLWRSTSDGQQRAPRARFIRSEPERVLGSLGVGSVPVARRQALFRVVVLRVYPNVQHLGVRARLSESERERDRIRHQIVIGAVETTRTSLPDLDLKG